MKSNFTTALHDTIRGVFRTLTNLYTGPFSKYYQRYLIKIISGNYLFLQKTSSQIIDRVVNTEATVCRCFSKTLFLIFSQYPQESTCVTPLQKRNSNTVASCEYCEIRKNSLLYRTPPVAASINASLTINIINLDQNSFLC